MATRLQLEYQLAQVELAKRQLELERRELELKHSLAQLNTVDVSSEESTFETEPETSFIKKSQPPSRRESSTELPTSEIGVSSSAANKNPLREWAPKLQLQQPLKRTKSKEAQVDEIISETASRGSKRKAASSSTPTQDSIATTSIEDPVDDEDILGAFLCSSKLRDSKLETGRKSIRRSDSNVTATHKSTLEGNGKLEVEDLPDDVISAKRSRVSRTEIEKDQPIAGALTEADHLALIKRYTELFLKHMSAMERKCEGEDGRKPVVVGKARRATNGKIHVSVSDLHQEFEAIIGEFSTNPAVTETLVEELGKFKFALPYWSAQCKGLPKQEDRLMMISNVVEEIASRIFDNNQYENDYDTNNEL